MGPNFALGFPLSSSLLWTNAKQRTPKFFLFFFQNQEQLIEIVHKRISSGNGSLGEGKGGSEFPALCWGTDDDPGGPLLHYLMWNSAVFILYLITKAYNFPGQLVFAILNARVINH